MITHPTAQKILKVGYLAETDCAPLAVACEFGLFQKYGLSVELCRQTHWKGIHDLVVQRELDAALAPAALPFLMRLGVTDESCRCVASAVISLEGNGITLSQSLWSSGVRDAGSLRERIFQEGGKRTYTFAVALPFSTQYFVLCEWLRLAGMMPAVRIIQVPHAQMFPLLKLGYLDGFCASEPWNALAADAGVGVCVAASGMVAPLHPEKVLMVREDFARDALNEHEFERLSAAVVEASSFCSTPANRPVLAELLVKQRYVDAPLDCVRSGLVWSEVRGAHIFCDATTAEPSAARADWITRQLYRFMRWSRRPAELDRVFRRDIYLRSRERMKGTSETPGTGASVAV